MKKTIEFAETIETEKFSREIQLLINVVEPDPGYQPFFVSDDACFFDITGATEQEIEAKLRFYFKGELPAALKTPLWRFAEIVKSQYPEWPENWPPEH